MLARDHALSGALVFTAAAPLLHVTGRPCADPDAVMRARHQSAGRYFVGAHDDHRPGPA